MAQSIEELLAASCEHLADRSAAAEIAVRERTIMLKALDAAETMLRCLPEISTNANGTKPDMTTRRAHALVSEALKLAGG